MDSEKFEVLLTKQMTLIRNYLIKIGARGEDAEDIVQDTLCKAIEYINAIDEDKMTSWLFKVALNRYYTLYNKEKKIRMETDELALLQLKSNDLIETQVLNSELEAAVSRVLDSLKESYRNLILLKYFFDYSYKEIAVLLGMDESTVKTYLYRARGKFKLIWEEQNHG